MKKLLFTFSALLVLSILVVSMRPPAKKSKTAVQGKIIFSNTPFSGTTATASKNSFTSAENIYARLELSSGTIKEAFKVKDSKMPFVKCKLTILQNGEQIHYGSSRDHILLSSETLNGNVLNFDVLPAPAKATTLYSMTDDFSAGYGFNPISGLIINGRWPDGDYTVQVKIYNETFSAYGSLQDEEKWPFVEDEFSFKFKEDDAVQIIDNDKKIRDNAIENSFRYDKLPPVFSNPGKLTDPNATQAKIAAILKRDLPKRTIIKWVAESYAGGYWHIAHDDWGLPKYKYFNPHIWMAYKIDGKCYVGDVTLRQVYSGGGTWGPLQVAFTSASGSGSDKGIDCIKVK